MLLAGFCNLLKLCWGFVSEGVSLLQKLKEFLEGRNLITKLEAKHDLIEKTMGESKCRSHQHPLPFMGKPPLPVCTALRSEDYAVSVHLNLFPALFLPVSTFFSLTPPPFLFLPLLGQKTDCCLAR